MYSADLDRLREQRDEAQRTLEEACRNFFTPGTNAHYARGGRLVVVRILATDPDNDYLCHVQNMNTGHKHRLRYEDLIVIEEN